MRHCRNKKKARISRSETNCASTQPLTPTPLSAGNEVEEALGCSPNPEVTRDLFLTTAPLAGHAVVKLFILRVQVNLVVRLFKDHRA
jgi:hypothetical protein